MEWVTIYIVGRHGFKEEVLYKLEHSSLRYMPGDIGTLSEQDQTAALFWLSPNTDLRTLKKAIGGKVIWKYRLRFYENLECFMESFQRPWETSAEDAELQGDAANFSDPIGQGQAF